MGENTAIVYILLASLMIFGAMLFLINVLDINALTFFSGVS